VNYKSEETTERKNKKEEILNIEKFMRTIKK